MVRVLIERWVHPGHEVCEARQQVRSRIGPLLAKPEQIAVLEPA
jgi:hypothetical protein